MKKLWQGGAMAGLLLVLAVAVTMLQSGRQTALGGAGNEFQVSGGNRYTVVATDGTHLVVTDNKDSKVLFYAIDQGGKPGDDLKFRGTINLDEVGKPVIKPTKAK